MMRRILGVALATLVITAASASAHEHKVMGTVTMVGADHVMMKTPKGEQVTVNVSKDTKITKDKDKTAVKLDTIKEGTRIVVTTASDDPPYAAMAIQVGATTTTPKKK